MQMNKETLKRPIKLFVSGMLILFLIVLCIPLDFDVKAAQSKESTKIRLVVDGTVYKNVQAKKVSSECDWYIKSATAKKIFGIKPKSAKKGYTGLRAVCKKLDYSYEYDEIMSAAYIWTNVPYSEECDDELMRAYQLGFASKAQLHALNKPITAKQFSAMLLKMIEHTGKNGAVEYFKKNVKADKKKLLRGESFVMAFYAAEAIGADTFRNKNDAQMQEEQEAVCVQENFWNAEGCRLDKLFPNGNKKGKKYPEVGINDKWDYKTLGYYWALVQTSKKTNMHIFEWDKNLSMRPTEKLTTKEAIHAVIRLYDSIPAGNGFDEMVPVDSSEAVTMDASLLTGDILKKIEEMPNITAENAPQWTGPVLQNSWYAYDPEMLYSDIDVHNFANWGFNSFRYNLAYESLFNEDVTKANLSNFKKLDEIVIAAVRYGIHFDIMLMTMPGRTASHDDQYNTTASLDLYINPKRQEEAKRVLAVLAERYKDIPNAILTLSPFWDGGADMATGLEAPEYDDEDYLYTLNWMIETIREKDSDRLLICELTGKNQKHIVEEKVQIFNDTILKDWDNIIFQANFCQNPYVYAGMTDTEGANIDLQNHCNIKPEYPVTIYAAQGRINWGETISLTGCLPKGTNIEIYLAKVVGSGEFSVMADGVALYTEQLSDTEYEVGEHMSVYYPFAESNKKIELSLDSDVDEILLSFTGVCMDWSGINVILPKEYAVERWYYESDYDAYIDGRSGNELRAPELRATSTVMICPNSLFAGRKIVILDSVEYTSEAIFEEANEKTAKDWLNMLSKYAPRAQLRLESPTFSPGASQKSVELYFKDVLGAMNKKGMGWYITGFLETLVVQIYDRDILAGGRGIDYKTYRNFNPELLFKIQECQP